MADDRNKPYVPGYLEDVFISYAHKDEGSEQWVTNFKRLLEEKLSYELDEPVRVWMDENLAAGDVLDAALKKRVRGSALMVSIVSRVYFERPWCNREMEDFFIAAEAERGIMVDTSSRFIPVVKRDPGAWPGRIEKINPIRAMFCKDDATFPPSKSGESDFFKAVQRLAQDLAKILRNMRTGVAQLKDTTRVLVFAPMSGSREKEAVTLRNWLTQKEMVVGPNGELPRKVDDLRDAILKEMETATMFIHLLGPEFDMAPAGARDRSVEAIALDLARQQALSTGQRQLIWAEREDPEDADQLKLIEHIRTTRDSHTELFTGEFSRFLEALPEELESRKGTTEQGVYVICQESDLGDPDYIDLRVFLDESGLPFTEPAFHGEIEELQKLETEQILSNSCTLIYFGSGKDAWVERKRSDTRKAILGKPATERPRRVLFLGPPFAVPPDKDLKMLRYGHFIGRQMNEVGSMSIVVCGGPGKTPKEVMPIIVGVKA